MNIELHGGRGCDCTEILYEEWVDDASMGRVFRGLRRTREIDGLGDTYIVGCMD